MNTLEEVLKAIKKAEEQSPIFKELQGKKLRLCIDGKQIVEIDTIEIIPRLKDLTLFVTSSKNVGYDGTEREARKSDLHEEMQSQPMTPEEAFKPPIITKADLIETLNKKNDDNGEDTDTKEDDQSEGSED